MASKRATTVSIPAALLELDEQQLLRVIKEQRSKQAEEQTKSLERFGTVIDAVFDSYAPDGEWVPQEFLVSYALVRLKASPRSYAATKEQLLRVLREGQGKRWDTQKGTGRGVRRLGPAAAKPKKGAKKG